MILHAVKCSPLDLLIEDYDCIVISNRTHPAMEGTNVTLSCLPGLIHTGPATVVCMGNGEWEPDPSKVKCTGKKYDMVQFSMIPL